MQPIPSLFNLREKLTTTLAITTTASDGNPSSETDTAVIMAGGVFWNLIDSDGIQNHQADIFVLEPPTEAAGHSDDTSCPSPKLHCSDSACVGLGNMCTTNGTAGWCACDNQNQTMTATETAFESCSLDFQGNSTNNGTSDSKVKRAGGCKTTKGSGDCTFGGYVPYCEDCGGELGNSAKCAGVSCKVTPRKKLLASRYH